MTPAEIFQGGKKINKITGDNIHEGLMNGTTIVVKDAKDSDNNPGCKVGSDFLKVGDSKTLESGEIIKSVKK